jgi:cysteinyl-tRNA synthetase
VRAGLPLHLSLAPREPAVYYRDFNDADFDCDEDGNLECVSIDEEAVQALVDERAVLRAARDYEAADNLKKRIIEMGVTIIDTPGREAWFLTPRRERGAKDAAKPGEHGYSRTGGAAPDEAALDAVDVLLAERLTAKQNGDYVRADELRAAMSALGVSVSDGSRQWRADGEAFDDDVCGRYARVPADGDRLPLDERTAIELVALRSAAKLRRDFTSADALRAQLCTGQRASNLGLARATSGA